MTLKEDLVAARALIDTPEKWIKGAYANGDCFCALGACRKAFFGEVYGGSKGEWQVDNNPLVHALERELPGDWLVHQYNDASSTTHADILALFQRAIEAASPETKP